jgi:hypothetical protein
MEQDNPNGWIPRIRLGGTITNANQDLLLDGDQNATITGVRMIGGEGSLRYLIFAHPRVELLTLPSAHHDQHDPKQRHHDREEERPESS